MSGRPKLAAVYPKGFCEAIIKALQIHRERVRQGSQWKGDVGVFEQKLTEVQSLYSFSRADVCDPNEEIDGRYIDDIRCAEMDPVLAKRARQEDLESFQRRNV